MRIRFVGGPLHNQIIGRVSGPARASAVRLILGERYELNRFETASGTEYLQYIHESLIANNGKPDACTYQEKFKKWKLCLGVR